MFNDTIAAEKEKATQDWSSEVAYENSVTSSYIPDFTEDLPSGKEKRTRERPIVEIVESHEELYVKMGCTYADLGIPILPLRPKSKLPLEKGWQKTLAMIAKEAKPLLKEWAKHGYNLGIRCGIQMSDDRWLLAMDIDIRDPNVGKKVEEALASLGLKDVLPNVISGRGMGSCHIYIAVPEEYVIQGKHELFVSDHKVAVETENGVEEKSAYMIDLCGDGRQMVGACSIHPDTGNPYELKHMDIIDAPEELLAIIRAKMSEKSAKNADEADVADDVPENWQETPESIAKIRSMLALIPADDYKLWLLIIWAIKSLNWACGLELAHEYSRKSCKYDSEGVQKVWDADNAEVKVNPITVGSLIYQAQQYGWKPDPVIAEPKVVHQENGKQILEVENGRFVFSEEGLAYYERGARKTTNICGRFDVVATIRGENNIGWGLLLYWHDADGEKHQFVVPRDALYGNFTHTFRNMVSEGFPMTGGKSAANLLEIFLRHWKVEKRARSVNRLGWHGDVYVTSNGNIGESDELIICQNAHAATLNASVSGSVDDWKNGIGRLAVGNNLVVFAICIAFAGVLLEITNDDSGGFHLRGASSSGKTTALRVSASVQGKPGSRLKSWRTTPNGLEGVAALHNDSTLFIDELSQLNAKDAGAVMYQLANGQGKSRADISGQARQVAVWQLLFLSTGEESFTGVMDKANQKVNAGQEIRMADIDADAGKGMGIFENLHDFPTPASLSDAFRDAAEQYYGAVGQAWVRRVVKNKADLAAVIATKKQEFFAKYLPEGAKGQVTRVAHRFALVGAAGDLATEYGLTGWEEGTSMNAAGHALNVWLKGFGGPDNMEERTILSHIRGIFELHGSSRFENMGHSQNEQKVHNRLGFYSEKGLDGRKYFVPSATFKREFCAGYDFRWVAATLRKAGCLVPPKNKDGSEKTANSTKVRLTGMGTVNCYVFNDKIWSLDVDLDDSEDE